VPRQPRTAERPNRQHHPERDHSDGKEISERHSASLLGSAGGEARDYDGVIQTPNLLTRLKR
jgi:hypothetical protein